MRKHLAGRFGVIAACLASSALTLGIVAFAGEAKPQRPAAKATDTAGPPGFGENVPQAVRDVLMQVHQEIGKQVPGIAKPILDQAVSDQKITQAQADQISQRLTQFASGPPPGPPPGVPGGDPKSGPPRRLHMQSDGPGPGEAGNPNVRDVLKSIMDAVAKQAPTIAKPILDQAVTDGKITQAQADQISQRLAQGGPMFVGGGCRRGGAAHGAKKRR